MILVTGGSGFVGGAIAASLGDRTITLSRSKSKKGQKKHICFDLTDTSRAPELIEQLRPYGITHIIHAAAITPWSNQPDYSKDTDMAAVIADIGNKLSSVTQVFFLSGWNVYSMSNQKAPYDENTLLGPAEDYGKSKLETEQYLKRKIDGARLANLRLSSVYGPGQTSAGLIPNLVQAAFKDEVMTIGAVKTSRDYIYIDDLAAAVTGLIDQELEPYTELNIGSGNSVSVGEVAETIQRICKNNYDLEVPIQKKDPIQESSIIDNRLDITLAREKYGLLEHTLSFTEGLSRYMDWVKS